MKLVRAIAIVALCCGAVITASADGRPPLTNGIHFDRSDPHTLYVASTFGLLVSHDDGCTMSWVCESDLGYHGTWDPKYAIATDGTIFATTFTGLRVSHDGGCSFTTATAELPRGTRNRIADLWIDAIDLGPTGDVWVGTAVSGAPNDVYVSHDNGVSFAAVGLQSPKIFWKSVRVAPTNLARVYAAGYEVAPPTAHLEISADGGATWSPSPLTGVAYGSTPIVLVAAVDPTTPDTFYLTSVGANRSGDRLYRTTDGGRVFRDVLDAPGPIQDVVVKDPRRVYVTTMVQSGPTKIGGPIYASTDGGATFAPIPNAPPLACVGVAPDGALIGCPGSWGRDRQAVARSTDGGATWSTVWRLGELAGPLRCPAGTAEHDQCELAEWPGVRQRFGASGPTCTGSATPASPAPAPPPPAPSGGCCDASGAPFGALWLVLGALWLGYRRSRQLG